jgi:hypothetical protein
MGRTAFAEPAVKDDLIPKDGVVGRPAPRPKEGVVGGKTRVTGCNSLRMLALFGCRVNSSNRVDRVYLEPACLAEETIVVPAVASDCAFRITVLSILPWSPGYDDVVVGGKILLPTIHA